MHPSLLSFLQIPYALWRYRNVHEANGGPISKLLVNKRSVSEDNCRPEFDAFCTLHKSLRPNIKSHLLIYDDFDGTGTASSQNIATVKAVSEALERWAFYECRLSKATEYGFDIENTTNGMAAHPGPGAQQARERSIAEALERWSLDVLWRNSILPTGRSKIDSASGTISLQINTGYTSQILFKKTEFGFVYGFACAKDRVQALERASVELYRNKRVLSRFFKRNLDPNKLSPQEERLLYFSTEDGFNEFSERLVKPKLNPLPVDPPRLILDKELIGPWNRFTHVWRCLVEMPSANAYNKDKSVFRF